MPRQALLIAGESDSIQADDLGSEELSRCKGSSTAGENSARDNCNRAAEAPKKAMFLVAAGGSEDE